MAKLSQIKNRPDNHFFGICLDNPKNSFNVGGVIRATAAFNGKFVAWSGTRFMDKGDWKTCDTEAGHLRMPCFKSVPDLMSMVPSGATPVAIELCKDAVSLFDFEHPRQAVYFFGSEDGTLNPDIVTQCAHKVFIPTIHSLNLANTVNILAYDRSLKMSKILNTIKVPSCPKCNHTYYTQITSNSYVCNACTNAWIDNQ